MSGARRLLLDEGPGERRAVVLLDGRPERLWIERDGEPPDPWPGSRGVARVRRIDRSLGMAFLDLGDSGSAVLPLSGSTQVTEGQAIEVEVAAPGRADKASTVRVVGPAEGPLGLSSIFSLTSRLQIIAPGARIERGAAAREAADLAEEEALAIEHRLPGGARIFVEATRAMVAVDVDVAASATGDRRRAAAKANRLAILEAARLLRLKGLGGLVVFDLAGGRWGDEVVEAARAAFAPDMPGVAYGPVSRLGVFHLALPWRSRPTTEILLDPDGRPKARTEAQRLARAIEREAVRAVRVHAACAPEVAAAAEALRPALVARLGPRFDIRSDPALGRAEFEVRAE